MRRLRALPALWLLLLLAAPAGAWVLGERQPLLQNRERAAFPALNRSSVTDPGTFARFDSALLDRLPLRETALDLRARVGLDLFHDSPNPDIAIGEDGWLYFLPEVRPCRPGNEPVSDPADAYEVLARTFVASGRRAAVIAVGSKLFTATRHAPDLDVDAEAARCAQALERRIAARLARTPGGLTLDPALRAMEARGEPAFLRFDTHWSWRARTLFVRSVLELARPGLSREVGLRAGPPQDRDGDLGALLGVERTELDRPVLAARRPRRPLPPGELVLIGDSQLGNALLYPPAVGVPSIRDRALPEQPSCDWSQLGAGACDAALRAARAVVLEQVARDTQLLTSMCWRPLLVAAERLDGWRPVPWERAGDESRALGARLTIPAAGTATVRFRPREDRAPVPRLLRLTVLRTVAQPDGSPTPVELAQRPGEGIYAPCATPAQTGNGDALLLPVPAGASASRLAVELRSAAGSRLGRPQELVLDGRVRR